jgi:hypothetical protein
MKIITSENVEFCLLIWMVMFIFFENVPTFSVSNSGIVLAQGFFFFLRAHEHCPQEKRLLKTKNCCEL